MGIEAEFIVKCDGCGITATDDYADEVYKWGEREAAEACEVPRWRRIAGKCYCPKCRPKLTLPERWHFAEDVGASEGLGDWVKGFVSRGQNHFISGSAMILRTELPVLLAAEVSAAAVRIAYDAIARPADFNRGEILALLAQALRAAEPEVTP